MRSDEFVERTPKEELTEKILLLNIRDSIRKNIALGNKPSTIALIDFLEMNLINYLDDEYNEEIKKLEKEKDNGDFTFPGYAKATEKYKALMKLMARKGLMGDLEKADYE